MAARGGFDRQLRLAAYVETCRDRGCTIADIAENVPGYGALGRSALEKALQRDCESLAESLGIVIEWSPVEQRYEVRPAMFTTEERRALIAAAAAVTVEGIGEDVGPGELGAAVSQDVAWIVVRVHNLVVDVRDAIAARQAITFRYPGHDSEPESRRVDPYVVGLWRNRWYFMGFDHARAERRVFRLDRIVDDGQQAAITDVGEPGAFEIPGDVDPIADMQMDPNAWGSDPPVVARVRVVHDLVPTFLGDLAGRIEEHGDTAVTVAVEVRDYESFIIRLLGFGTAVTLLAPDDLRARMHAWIAGQATG